MNESMTQRPVLNTRITLLDFKDFYWTKLELINFCRENNLSSQGGKLELAGRIEQFLVSGNSENFEKILAPNKTGKLSKIRDSELGPLTKTTPVILYKSDVLTREFFQKEIGPHFKFNADVLVWIKNKISAQECLTYGDIIDEWLKQDRLKKDPSYTRPIPEQFQFNQFMSDWKKAGAGKGEKEAWNWLRDQPGEPTYGRYLELMKGLKARELKQ